MSKFNFNNNYKHNIDNKNLIIRKNSEKFCKDISCIFIIFPLSNKLIAKPGDKLSNSLHNTVSCITVIRRHNCSYRIRHNAYLSKSLYTTSSLSI